jgi:hypothetical protein
MTFTDVLTTGLLSQMDYYVRSASKHVTFAKTAHVNDPSIVDIWFEPARQWVIVRKDCLQPEDDLPAPYKIAAAEENLIPDHWCGLSLAADEYYFAVARELADQMMGLTKSAATVAQKAYSLLGWDDRYYPTNPVAAMLATGILGAGLGYGGASLASAFLPKNWDKKKFRRSGMLLGGTIGAAPGALETLKSLMIGQPVLDGSHMQLKKDKLRWLADHAGLKRYSDSPDHAPSSYLFPLLDSALQKSSEYPEIPLPRYSPLPQISGDDLMKMTWQHPLVSRQMTSGQQALLSGAVHGAQAIAGSPIFTPQDMARLTAGMGSGYAMGLAAGKVLGVLSGMPQSAQNTLANTGALAGSLKAVLPLIYGR